MTNKPPILGNYFGDNELTELVADFSKFNREAAGTIRSSFSKICRIFKLLSKMPEHRAYVMDAILIDRTKYIWSHDDWPPVIKQRMSTVIKRICEKYKNLEP